MSPHCPISVELHRAPLLPLCISMWGRHCWHECLLKLLKPRWVGDPVPGKFYMCKHYGGCPTFVTCVQLAEAQRQVAALQRAEGDREAAVLRLEAELALARIETRKTGNLEGARAEVRFAIVRSPCSPHPSALFFEKSPVNAPLEEDGSERKHFRSARCMLHTSTAVS